MADDYTDARKLDGTFDPGWKALAAKQQTKIKDALKQNQQLFDRREKVIKVLSAAISKKSADALDPTTKTLMRKWGYLKSDDAAKAVSDMTMARANIVGACAQEKEWWEAFGWEADKVIEDVQAAFDAMKAAVRQIELSARAVDY